LIYPSELVEEVTIGFKNPKIRRVLRIYRKAFGVDPAHIGGYYDAAYLLKVIRFSEFYARMRNRRAVAIIKQLRKELSACRRQKK
jgi:hypothetical protein